MKIWRGNEKTDDKIIALINSTIYKGNPADDEIEHCLADLRNGIIPARKFIGIPLHYIKEIRMQEGKSYLQIFFGKDSEEHIKLHEETLKQDVFAYFKANIAGIKFSVDHYSKLRAGKKPLIAFLIITVLFLWTLYYAFGFDSGNQYEVAGGHYNSITGIVLSIASLGVTKTSILFSIFLLIAGLAFISKAKNPPVIHRLTFIRK